MLSILALQPQSPPSTCIGRMDVETLHPIQPIKAVIRSNVDGNDGNGGSRKTFSRLLPQSDLFASLSSSAHLLPAHLLKSVAKASLLPHFLPFFYELLSSLFCRDSLQPSPLLPLWIPILPKIPFVLLYRRENNLLHIQVAVLFPTISQEKKGFYYYCIFPHHAPNLQKPNIRHYHDLIVKNESRLHSSHYSSHHFSFHSPFFYILPFPFP